MRHLTPRVLRPVAVLAAGAVIATTVPAEAATPADSQAAHWLTTQLSDHLIHNQQFDQDDFGLSADVALALDSIGGKRRAVRRIGGALAENADAWTAPAEGEVYAGPTAKAAVLAEVTGRDPRRFGGVDLVARLEERTADAAPITGRIEDQSEYGDFANTIGQGFAALALAQAGSEEAPAARTFLLSQQCDEGYFRLNFSDKAAVDQSCESASELSAPDVDATALSLLALLKLPTKGKLVRAAIDNATDWLHDAQRRDGSFRSVPDADLSNANSTGLAAWALGEAGACRTATKSARWVRDLQVRGVVKGSPFAGDEGAIAYDRPAFKAGKTDGITRKTRDRWRRTTAQAAPGLSFLHSC